MGYFSRPRRGRRTEASGNVAGYCRDCDASLFAGGYRFEVRGKRRRAVCRDRDQCAANQRGSEARRLAYLARMSDEEVAQ